MTAAGVLAEADTVKSDSLAAIAALRRLDLDIIMLTGDNARIATAIAGQTGISRVLAEVLPEHKASEIQPCKARAAGLAWSATASTTARAGGGRHRPGDRNRH